MPNQTILGRPLPLQQPSPPLGAYQQKGLLTRGRVAYIHRAAERDCTKRSTSDAPTVYLACIRKAKWAEKSLFGGLHGCTDSTSEASRTVFELSFPKSGLLMGF